MNFFSRRILIYYSIRTYKYGDLGSNDKTNESVQLLLIVTITNTFYEQ